VRALDPGRENRVWTRAAAFSLAAWTCAVATRVALRFGEEWVGRLRSSERNVMNVGLPNPFEPAGEATRARALSDARPRINRRRGRF